MDMSFPVEKKKKEMFLGGQRRAMKPVKEGEEQVKDAESWSGLESILLNLVFNSFFDSHWLARVTYEKNWHYYEMAKVNNKKWKIIS